MSRRSSDVAVEDEKPSFVSETPLSAPEDTADDTADEAPERNGSRRSEVKGEAEAEAEGERENPLALTDTETGREYISGLQLVIVMACVVLVAFIMLLDTSIIATAIPRITDDFHSLEDIGWYASSYQLSSAALQPLTGKLFNNFSSKWTFMSFFGIFEIGSLLCGVATSSTMLIVGRAVAGMGAAGLMNGAMTIVAGSVPLHKRAAIMGILMGISQLGIVAGPLIGGALTEYATWRWCFYINLPIGGAVAIFLVVNRIPDQIEKPDPKTVFKQLHRSLDLVGFALFAPAPIQLLLALQYGGHKYPWNSSTVIGLICGSAATFAVWAYWNYRKGDDALLPFSMVKKRAVWSSSLTAMFLFGSMLASSYFLPIYFQAVKGVSPVKSGVYTLPTILSQLVTAVLSGVISGKLGFVTPWALASGVVSALAMGLFSRFGPDTPSREWIGFQIIGGLGRGMGMQMPLLAIQASLKPSEIAIAISLLSFSQYVGTAIFLVIANTIFSETLKSSLEKYAPNADAAAIIASGGTAFRGFVSPEDLPGVLLAFSKATDGTFYLAAGLAAGSFFTAWGMGWVDIRKKKKTPVTGDA